MVSLLLVLVLAQAGDAFPYTIEGKEFLCMPPGTADLLLQKASLMPKALEVLKFNDELLVQSKALITDLSLRIQTSDVLYTNMADTLECLESDLADMRAQDDNKYMWYTVCGVGGVIVGAALTVLILWATVGLGG